MKATLAGAGIDNATREAEWLLDAALGSRSRALVPDTGTDAAVGEKAASDAVELARRRAAGEPLQYITGVAGFRRIELAVGPGVLVPRPETEIVAGRAMELLPHGGSLVDVGTGCGAIALAVADERPDAKVFATESSPDARSWARRNIDGSGLDVELASGDLLEGLPRETRGGIDVVVSNPPYVGTAERPDLPADVVNHEPHEALFAGERGLDVIERLVPSSLEWLGRDGWLVVEIAPAQAGEVKRLMSTAGFDSVAVGRDLAGRDRLVEGRRP